MKVASSLVRRWRWLFVVCVGAAVTATGALVHADGEVLPGYRWIAAAHISETLAQRISPPAGFVRVEAPAGSFARFLRHMPVRPAGTPVRLFNGEPKWNQSVHAAVFDVDVERRDLQQCADAVMRLRAEYLFSAGRAAEVCFNNVSGRPMCWRDHRGDGFRKYLSRVFAFANSRSLYEQMEKVRSVDGIEPGQVFIEPARNGRYGHAVLVMDVAKNARNERVFLLAQSYMPAQDIHLLKNPSNQALSPWYRLDDQSPLDTPEWTFPPDSLRRFP